MQCWRFVRCERLRKKYSLYCAVNRLLTFYHCITARRSPAFKCIRVPFYISPTCFVCSPCPTLRRVSSPCLTLSRVCLCASQLSIGAGVLCLPVLRWTQPNLARPIRVNLFWPVIYIIATIFITIMPMIAKPVETGGCRMYS